MRNCFWHTNFCCKNRHSSAVVAVKIRVSGWPKSQLIFVPKNPQWLLGSLPISELFPLSFFNSPNIDISMFLIHSHPGMNTSCAQMVFECLCKLGPDRSPLILDPGSPLDPFVASPPNIQHSSLPWRQGNFGLAWWQTMATMIEASLGFGSANT